MLLTGAILAIANVASAQVSAEAQIEPVHRLLPAGAAEGLEFILPTANGDAVYQARGSNSARAGNSAPTPRCPPS